MKKVTDLKAIKVIKVIEQFGKDKLITLIEAYEPKN